MSDESRMNKWLWIKLLGGVLLAIAFFMPTMKYGGCEVNNRELWVLKHWNDLEDECWRDSTHTLSKWEIPPIVICSRLSTILFFLSPYLLGLLISLGVLSRFAGLGQSTRFLNACQCWLLLFMSLIPILALISGHRTYDMAYYYDCSSNFMEATIGAILLLYILCANRNKNSLFITSAWAGAVFYLYWCIAWYLYFRRYEESSCPGDGPRIGLHLASIGLLTIFVASTAEAILYARLPWWRGLIGLITANLRHGPSEHPECENCGYSLVGLSEPRCPECGRLFDPKLITDILPIATGKSQLPHA